MSTVADFIPSPGEPAPVGLVSPPVTTPEPSGTAPKRTVGRPKGSKTKRPNSARRTAATAASAAASEALGGPSPAKGPGRPSTREAQNAKMEEGLRNFYVGLGAMLRVTGGAIRNRRAAAVGAEMVEQADMCARALVAWSDQNASVRKFLEQITTAGGAALVLSAHTPIVMAALAPPEMGDGADLLGSLLGMFGGMDEDGTPSP